MRRERIMCNINVDSIEPNVLLIRPFHLKDFEDDSIYEFKLPDIYATNGTVLKAKKIKCPKIITKIFKTGGEIAYKNLKRSKRKYRTTVISIIVSVVIFIAISSFIQYGFKMSNSYYTERNYIAVVHGITKDKDTIKSYLKETKTLI